jgi:hypothetical protein
MGICSGQQAEAVVHNAQAALAAVQQRHAGGGSWTLYPAELDALHWLAALHAKQLAECDYSEFERAWRQKPVVPPSCVGFVSGFVSAL